MNKRKIYHEKTCQNCGTLYGSHRSDSRVCSQTCKKALQRGGWKRKRSDVQRQPFHPYHHGALVLFWLGDVWHPGKVNRHCDKWHQTQRNAALGPSWEWQLNLIPVEDFTGIRVLDPRNVKIP